MLNGIDQRNESYESAQPEQVDNLKAVIREVMADFMRDERWLPQAEKSEPITAGERRILDAMRWLEQNTGKIAFKPDIVAYFSKNAAESPGFGDAHRSLRRKGLITRVYGGYFQLTALGREASQPRNAILSHKKESTDTAS